MAKKKKASKKAAPAASSSGVALEIQATAKVLERVYHAIELCKKWPERSAQSINKDVKKKFGVALAGAYWTVLNAARKEGKLDQVVTKEFDFSKHGRNARTGKRRARRKDDEATPRTPTGSERILPNAKKHPRYIVAVWNSGKTSYIRFRTRKAAEREVRKLARHGVALGDIAVYACEAMSFDVRL